MFPSPTRIAFRSFVFGIPSHPAPGGKNDPLRFSQTENELPRFSQTTSVRTPTYEFLHSAQPSERRPLFVASDQIMETRSASLRSFRRPASRKKEIAETHHPFFGNKTSLTLVLSKPNPLARTHSSNSSLTDGSSSESDSSPPHRSSGRTVESQR